MCHVVTFIYLKSTGKYQDIYDQLKISKWLIVLLLLVGLMMGSIYNDNKMEDASSITRWTVALGATLIVPLIILGMIWVKLIGELIFVAILSLFIK